ncbi:MAG: hypothetical protein Q8J78_02395 [Moraxellaceae bacterium]|nr:hypothetical protein [Moraxellaceae bacterium]
MPFDDQREYFREERNMILLIHERRFSVVRLHNEALVAGANSRLMAGGIPPAINASA